MTHGIIDDPVKGRADADSPAHREHVWGWYNGDFLSRTSGDSSILITCTRWHPDDLPGRLLKLAASDTKADQWEVLCLPALCTTPGDGIGSPRKPGDPLWAERHPLSSLEAKRAASSYDWDSLYQQNPRNAGSCEWDDDLFPASIWFDQWPSKFVAAAMALDPSKGKSDKFGDYSAFVFVGVDAQGTLWIDADLERRSVARIVSDGIALWQRWQKPQAFAIETNAFQELLGKDFIREAKAQRLAIPLYGLTNTVNKLVRIRAGVGPHLAQRRCRFNGRSVGARLLVQQLRDFPTGEHDDGPDSLDMAIRMIEWLLGKREAGPGQPEMLRA